MAHRHHHDRPFSLNRAFIVGIILNAGFVAAEFAAGFCYGSSGLLSDAGHNLGDVTGLVLAMLAFLLAGVRSNARYTYGYKKSTVLVSLLNAFLLFGTVGLILAESIGKLFHPRPVDGNAIAWVAGAGMLVNGLTAWLFMKAREKDLNVRGAYLHMAADALVSAGVVVSGIVIRYTGWYLIDPLIGMAVATVILVSSRRLFTDSLRLSLDGVPRGVDSKRVGEIIGRTLGVSGFHHLHIWALSTTENALTVHIVSGDMEHMEDLKSSLKDRLRLAGITHATLEFERPECVCCRDGAEHGCR